jgi:hypothetical protein
MPLEAELRQFMVEFNNFDGAAELISEYGLPESEIQQVSRKSSLRVNSNSNALSASRKANLLT